MSVERGARSEERGLSDHRSAVRKRQITLWRFALGIVLLLGCVPSLIAQEPYRQGQRRTAYAGDPRVRQAQVRGVQPQPSRELFGEQERSYRVELEPPPPARLFRIESETRWRERIRQEFRQLGRPVAFPEEASFAEETPAKRIWQPTTAVTTPRYVCYNPLYFEDKNVERYGWNLGMFQPIASTGKFYYDLFTFPYNTGVIHPCAYESSAGYCLPNDRVPYMVYVPPLSIKGAFLQAGTIAGGIAIFP